MIVFYVALSAGGVSAGFEEAPLPQAVARQERFKKNSPATPNPLAGQNNIQLGLGFRGVQLALSFSGGLLFPH
jgi:hypothetical protein